ncbi:MAG: DUF2437 domain-containing protein, partial [Paraburkholderia sp.]
MKITRFKLGDVVAYGDLRDDGTIERLSGSPFDGEVHLTGTYVAASDVRLLAPVENPRIFGAGFNYVSHI